MFGATGLLAGAGAADAAQVFALTDTNGLFVFDDQNPSDDLDATIVSGLVPRDNLIGIDFRLSAADPALRGLYAVGTGGGAANSSRVYRIDSTLGGSTFGAATVVSTLSPDPADNTTPPDPFDRLRGTRFGLDFNPVPDRLRVTSNQDQNLRINADTGLVQNDGTLQYAAGDPAFGANPSVVGSAYTNNDLDAATGTALYGVDSVRNTLVLQSNPNAGTLQTVGALGFDASSLVGFDIFTVNGTNIGYAALQNASEGVSTFYTIDLATGTATLVGGAGETIDGGDLIDGIAVVPEPAGIALLGLGAAGLLARRRRA